MNSVIWEGVFERWEDAAHEGPGFSGPVWIENSVTKAKKHMAHAGRGYPVSNDKKSQGDLLPFLSAVISAENQALRILDFGGGVGSSYEDVHIAVEDMVQMHYCVVDLNEVCNAGRHLHGGNPNICFCTELPDRGVYDIVNMGSSIQYIPDWRDLVDRLSKFKPTYFLLSNTPIGDVPTFVTLQHYYGSKIPCWFLNLNEVLEAFQKNAYRAIYKVRNIPCIWGEERPYPMDNFKTEYRLEYPSTILFRREITSADSTCRNTP